VNGVRKRLEGFGWNELLEAHLAALGRPAWVPGRVTLHLRNAYIVVTEEGEIRSHAAGRLRHAAAGPADYPAVGDWVALQSPEREGAAIIHAVLPRRSAFIRKEAGSRTIAQILAANIDIAFLVSGLDGELNPRRIERALVLAHESGARPVVVLNKADLLPPDDELMADLRSVAGGVPLLPVSARDGTGIAALRALLPPGITGVLIGSSGVGKSSIMNRLFGTDIQEVGEVRASDGEGRHTTRRRELIELPGGGMLVDTPGIRELQLWGAGGGMDEAFEEIRVLAARCRFTDCRHDAEPGCAVLAALEEGSLEPDRLESYRKLLREVAFMERRRDGRAAREEKLRWKKITAAHKRGPHKGRP
jgi:ribosome biogenesis GTPase